MKKITLVVFLITSYALFNLSAQDKLTDYSNARQLFKDAKYFEAQNALTDFLAKYGDYSNASKMLRDCNSIIKKNYDKKTKKSGLSPELRKARDERDQALEDLRKKEEERKMLQSKLESTSESMIPIEVAEKEIKESINSLKNDIEILTKQKQEVVDSLNKTISSMKELEKANESLRVKYDNLFKQINQLDSLSKKQFLGLITYKAVEKIIHPEKF